MVQQVRALASRLDNWSLIPGAHVSASDSCKLSSDLQTLAVRVQKRTYALTVGK